MINEYLPEGKYIHGKDDVFWSLGTFPVLSSETERKVKTIKTYDYNMCQKEKPKDREFKTGCRQYDYTSLNEFIEFGFDFEPFGLGKHILRSIPKMFLDKSNERAVSELINDIDEGTGVNEIKDKFAATIACHFSIRAG